VVLLYACSQQASDSAGVRVGGSISATARERAAAGALDGDDTDTDANRPDHDNGDPGLEVDPDALPDADTSAAALPGPGGATPPSPGASAATPSTEPPTAIDLLVDKVTVPSTSHATVDGCGDPLDFGARQMIDGIDRTTWRMDGDGTGETLVFELEGPRRVLSVGLVPGFDAVDPCDRTDRFVTGRRITDVTWEFDDGHRFKQRFIDVGTLQRIDVDATTTKIRLHIDGVTADPQDDYTAVSELVVRGV
jgi:hypothetical protein